MVDIPNKKVVLSTLDLLQRTIENSKEISDFNFRINFDITTETPSWTIKHNFSGWKKIELIIQWQD